MPSDQPTPPLRKASTVILVRESRNSFEVYLLKRNVKSGFMGGYHVFPGGTLDPEDTGAKTWAPHIDLTPQQIAQQLGDKRLSNFEALDYGIAAIRETLEESGVLLATGKNKSSKEYESISRQRLEKGLPKTWFNEKVHNDKWILSFSLLFRWSHWITPEQMKSRYDTRFFVARMPADQTCLPDNHETQDGLWLTPQSALKQNLAEIIAISPPTLATLTQMSKFKTFKALMQALPDRVWGEPIMPRVVSAPDGPVILEPWDPFYDSKADIEIQDPSNKVLPPGKWFSRIWRDGHIWKPIGT